MFSIIKTCEKKTFGFKNINDINNYRFKTDTDQSNYFIESICAYFKLISKTDLYYYDFEIKLWKMIAKDDFLTFAYDFYNNSAKEIGYILRKQENIDKEVKKNIKELIKDFDSQTYVKDVSSRSFSKLQDSKFLPLLNSLENFLPIMNGKKINLKTGEVSDRLPTDFFSYESPVEYLKETPNADKFFKQIQPNEENRELVRKVLGYTLTGNMDARKFFIWYGYGSNGKSKLFNSVEKILQCQYTQVHPSIFIKAPKSSAGAASPEIMDLMGKRAGIHSEGETADSQEMNMGGIKGLSGKDKFSGRHLYGSKVDFYPTVKLHLLTNYTPPLDGQKATADRLVYIFMDTNFTNNPKNKNDIMIDNDFANKIENEYLSEMFSWMVKGSIEYYKDLKIEMTDEFKQRTQNILSSADSITSFFSRGVKKANFENFVRRSDLFSAYMRFCSENSMRCQKRSSLFNRIEELGALKSTLDGYDGYRYVDFVDNPTEIQINYFNQGVSTEDKSIDAISEFKQIVEQNKAEIERLQQIEIMYKQLLEEKQNNKSKLDIVKSMTLSKPKQKEQTKPKPISKPQNQNEEPQSYRTFDVEDFIQNSIDESMKDQNDIFDF